MNHDADISQLARELDRLERLRCAKDVQRRYAQLLQRGRWADAATLFATDATLHWGQRSVHGAERIGEFLTQRAGAAAEPGGLCTELIDAPVVHLSPRGDRAFGRWSALAFLGDGAGTARVEGGLYENEYVLDDGRWLIASMRFHPQFDGDDLEGWSNIDGAQLPIVPTHFGAFDAGTPLMKAIGAAPQVSVGPGELAARIARLNDEDAVRNLVHAYGYYLDRRMWSDVVDLFTAGATVRIDDDVHHGTDGIRQACRKLGPEGLQWGQVAERPIFDLTVEISESGDAVAHGIQLGILGDVGLRSASWEFCAVAARLRRGADGLWRFDGLEADRLLSADYSTGWGRGGTRARRAASDLTAAAARRSPLPASEGTGLDVADLARRLRRSLAYDGVENVSSAYGFFLDDFRWADMAALFARRGHKQSAFAGYSIGPEAILGTAIACYGPTRPFRSALSFHWRTQPVIHVSHDGRSAHLRTRLFQPRTAQQPEATPADFFMGGLHSGMYPNDQAVFEDGTWRLWSLAVDEHHVAMHSWRGGWIGVQPRRPGDVPRASIVLTAYPPEILLRDIVPREEGFRGGPGELVEWPAILPMWFHYRNPVSGRVPERYWPDCVPCEVAPHTRMTEHGYEHPPNGPERDGRERG